MEFTKMDKYAMCVNFSATLDCEPELFIGLNAEQAFALWISREQYEIYIAACEEAGEPQPNLTYELYVQLCNQCKADMLKEAEYLN